MVPTPTNFRTEEETTVLVVDDAAQMRKLVCSVLKKHGFKTIDVADGCYAIHRLEESHYDAIITDLEMPQVSGDELVAIIRNSSDPTVCNVPIIVVSSKADAGTIAALELLGIDAFIEKPVDQIVLLETIDRLLKTSREMKR